VNLLIIFSFAFNFLLEFAKMIPKDSDVDKNNEDKSYINLIRKKVQVVCQCHLEWLLNTCSLAIRSYIQVLHQIQDSFQRFSC
jgi:hypothetical protein